MAEAKLVLEDGSKYTGISFGSPKSVAGEVVFNTGMVGYPESLTDPSYRGQILVFTYPLIGNYGMPRESSTGGMLDHYESQSAQIKGLIVLESSIQYEHRDAATNLDDWLEKQEVPALCGVDTRSLTKKLRDRGTMLGKIIVDHDIDFFNPNKEIFAPQVSVSEPVSYPGNNQKVVVLDCGCKNSIIRALLKRGVTVKKVPWDYDLATEDFNGLLISSGPGDPKIYRKTIQNVKKILDRNLPILGICLGHQILALASGADTYKLKFGHRSQNQPCLEVGGKRCFITSQNHGFAVDPKTLHQGWQPWFFNLNDGSNEGIRHETRPFLSVQFHPEASPGPTDTNFIFDQFIGML